MEVAMSQSRQKPLTQLEADGFTIKKQGDWVNQAMAASR
jgi:hypothetical protein